MKNKLKKVLSLIMVTVIALGLIGVPTKVKADDATNTVTVIVRNDTFSMTDGAVWDGELLNVEVDITGLDTLPEILKKAFDDNQVTVDGLDYGYISGINGLDYTSHPNGMGGFMSSINGWFTSEGISAYSISNGNLRSGDVIEFEYSTDWGADIGSDWMGTDTSLAALTLSDGELDNVFDKDITEYVLTLTDADEVNVVPVPVNRNFQVRIYKNDYTPDSNDYYRATDSIPVSTGDTIWIGVGETSWPSMNAGQTATVYKLDINVETSRNANELSDEETTKALASANEMYEDTFANLSKTEPSLGSIGGEWLLLSVLRSTLDSSNYGNSYYELAKELVKNTASDKLSSTKATENVRVILALNALGYKPESIEGYNLYAPLSDIDYVTKQGVNGAIWALIAFDSVEYEGDRQPLIDAIVSAANAEGALTFDGTTSDADLTAMALIALAPYSTDTTVSAFIENALNVLSNMQDNEASYGTVETNAQVLTALSTLSVDCLSDARFIKNNKSLIDALALNYIGDGKFAHSGNDFNQMSTEQALIALDAYYRMKDSKTSVYDMSDVDKLVLDTETVNTPATGDSANMLQYGLLLMFAAVVVLQAKKKKNI